MAKKTSLWALLLVMLVTMLTAGCGGGGGEKKAAPANDKKLIIYTSMKESLIKGIVEGFKNKIRTLMSTISLPAQAS